MGIWPWGGSTALQPDRSVELERGNSALPDWLLLSRKLASQTAPQTRFSELPLARTTPLGSPSWSSLVVSVRHKHAGTEGMIEVITRARRGAPLFLASVNGPQLRPLPFAEVKSDDRAHRVWRASYSGLCRPGVYWLALRLLLNEFDPSDERSLAQQIKQVDYLPIVDTKATSWELVDEEASTECALDGFHWEHGTSGSLMSLPLLDAWKHHNEEFQHRLKHE